ncbi:MAG: DUF6501 family protein [Paraclostridium sp.]
MRVELKGYGTRVECTSNNCMVGILTKGKIYDVFREMEEFYIILDDTNQIRIVNKYYLKPIKEEKHEESENDYHIRDGYCSIFIPGRGGKNTFKKHIEKLRAINPILFAKEYLLHFGTEVNETDFPKDVKDKGIKVRCIKNNKGQNVSEIELTLNKEYLVLEEDGERYYVENNLGEKRGYFKQRFEVIKEDKMEEVRIVRKLEDLDGLENRIGLYIDSNLDVRVKNKNMLICYGNDLTGERKENYLEALKAMGFKFDYKPLRTKEEVKAEMLSKCKEFKFNGYNYYIKYIQQDERYYVSYDCFNDILGALYFDKKTANEYCNELNEILKNN